MCGSDGELQYSERTSEQVMVDMIREDLGVSIDPQAWRMFVRHRFGRIAFTTASVDSRRLWRQTLT